MAEAKPQLAKIRDCLCSLPDTLKIHNREE